MNALAIRETLGRGDLYMPVQDSGASESSPP
jgi:hypothetical protein